MDPAGKKLWIRGLQVCGGIIGSGVLLFKYTVPTPEELIAKMSPEVRADYERNKEFRRQENEALMEVIKKTTASNDPIWMAGPIKAPWDRDHVRTSDSPLLDRDSFEKEQAHLKQVTELERLKKAEEELNVPAQKGSKSWYKLW